MLEMSFLRKFVSKLQLRKRSNCSVDGEEDVILPIDDRSECLAGVNNSGWVDRQTDRQSDSSRSATSLGSDEECRSGISLSAASLDRKLRKKRKSLNRKLDKYRRERWRVEQKAAELEHLHEEIVALMAMLSQLNKHKHLLDLEKNNKLREMALTCKLVCEDVSPELRKKEPLQFKKYYNVKTMSDVQSLLRNIHLKQKALHHLEVLSFKKLLDFEHQGLSTLAKNNNNTTMSENMETMVKDVLARFENSDLREAQINFSRSHLLLQTTALINSVGIVPSSFDNPLFESLV